MVIGILKCDKVKEPFAARYGEYPDMFARLLHSVRPDIEFVIFDAQQNDLPADIDAVDAYLITGSHHGVNDKADWIRSLEDFVRRLHTARKKIIGICFGHQIVASALGGVVSKSPNGWGVGIKQNEITLKKEWMKPFKGQIGIIASHQDQVIELPEHAEVIASSDFCPNYMMQIGTHIITIQGHPEFTTPYARDLLQSREEIIDKHIVAQGMQSFECSPDDSLIAQWIINFLYLS